MADERQHDPASAIVLTRKLELPQRPINPFSPFADKLCKVKLQPAPKALRKELATVKVALVSMPSAPFKPFSSSTLGDRPIPGYVDPAACERSLVSFPDDTAAARLATFRDALTSALDMGARVVCVSELGFPTEPGLAPSPAAIQLARELSEQHQALIIAGSAHDATTLYNTGFLFCPGTDNLTFHKALSAIPVTERVSVPCERNIFAVHIFGLRIATMICLDIADYISVASVVRVNDQVDMILAPCYTMAFEKMSRVARAASQALPGIVALANASSPWRKSVKRNRDVGCGG